MISLCFPNEFGHFSAWEAAARTDALRILVIGGTRYFGKRLVQKFLNENHDVFILSRGNAKDNFGSGVHRLICDRRNQERLSSVTKNLKWGVIIDQVCMNANDAMSALEIFGTKTEHYIMTSSQSVYDSGTNLNESAFDPYSYQFKAVADETKDYKEAKRQAETVFAKSKGFPITIIRPPIVLGEDDYTGRLKFHIGRTIQGQPIYFPNIDAKISFINSDCAANAILHVSKHPALGPLNIASKSPVRLSDLMSQIGEVVGKRPSLSDIPTDNHWSPFGINEDWFMNIEKSEKTGIKTLDIDQWLPSLIKTTSDSCQIK